MGGLLLYLHTTKCCPPPLIFTLPPRWALTTTGWNSSPVSVNLSTRYLLSCVIIFDGGLEGWNIWLLVGKLFGRNRRQSLSSRRQSSKSWSPTQWGFHNVHDVHDDEEDDDDNVSLSRDWEEAFSGSPQELVDATRATSQAASSILVMLMLMIASLLGLSRLFFVWPSWVLLTWVLLTTFMSVANKLVPSSDKHFHIRSWIGNSARPRRGHAWTHCKHWQVLS